ncbi:MAG: ETC complex I subunit [Devosiaceae bacterium]|nr:ETC complex I subunit [Devosiaceae bacterium]
MSARIYRPSPNPMQSGKGNSNQWILEFDPATKREIEPLMGYSSTSDMQSQIQLSFESKEQAEAYAKKQGLDYRVEIEHVATPKRVSYPENFSSTRKTPWTH